jgi:alpha-beta hydrolase superfamily lysophospholipase
MVGRAFYFISSLLVLFGAFILLSPSLVSPDIIYPLRIDSTYITYQAKQDGDEEDTILLSPSDVGLKYSDLHVITTEGYILNGWYVGTEDTTSNTILIIHDINESRIIYIDHMRQFHDRGFNVCVFDLRAHGTSGGTEFSPGIPLVKDVELMVDSALAKKKSRNLVLMGVGIGAAIAVQTAIDDDRCTGIILQSPFNNFENYLDRYAQKKWGIMKDLWYPVLKRKTESLLQYPVKELDLTEIIKYTAIPQLFIIGSSDEKTYTSETLQVFDASDTEKKELFLVRNAGKQNIAKVGGEQYYNRISAFLLSSLPKPQKKTRFKKLVLNDH